MGQHEKGAVNIMKNTRGEDANMQERMKALQRVTARSAGDSDRSYPRKTYFTSRQI